jgi:hypothetical protein
MLHNYSQLLIDVQKKSNITVSNVRDIKFLKEELESITAKSIGFNTLRRLFGFLESKKPSVKTLNTLSNYLGFTSYSNYNNNQINYDEWYYQQNLLRLLSSKDIDEQELNFIKNGLRNEQNVIYLAYYLSYHIKKNNINILETIFNNIDFNIIADTEMQKFSMIVSSSLSGLSENKSLKFYQRLISLDAFRNYVPLLFIDYNNLNSKYFKILEFIEELAANNSDLLFVSLMKYYKEFYLESNKFNIEISKPNNFDNLYITLQGRYYGYLILKSDELNKELKSEIIKKCKKNNVSFFALEIISALIIKEHNDFLEEIFSLFYEELLENNVWSSKTTNAIYLIALATINIKNNKIKAAKTNLKLIELKKVELSYESYVSLFYYLTMLKISFFENDKLKNKHTLSLIKKTVKSNSFSKFITEAKKYLIS